MEPTHRTDLCTDPDDVIAEVQHRHSFPSVWVGRCLHGITSQGDSRDQAVEMTLEACALAHEDVRPADDRPTLTLHLDQDLIDRLARYCRDVNRDVNGLLVFLIEEGLDARHA